MPILPGLDFVNDGLFVRYRGSAEPQELDIEIRLAAAAVEEQGPQQVASLIDLINEGLSGGAEFSPSTGAAELVRGPWDPPESLGPELRWTLRVVGVAPLFLRTVVEKMRWCALGTTIVWMRIQGSLPLDDGPLSVHEPLVRAWLDDPRAYLGRWPSPGFRILTTELAGATLRVQLGARITEPIREEVQAMYLGWRAGTREYVSDAGTEPPFTPDDVLPTFAFAKTEFQAAFKAFTNARDPSRDLLVNALTRFHERVAPIVEAEIGL